MDLAQQLVRSCVRAFYETKLILVIDALIIHSALRDDDLAYLMSMNTKEVHKLCGKLRGARFLEIHTRPETKEGQQRPMNRTYYYIDYRAAIDAIKWRVYLMNKEVQGNTVAADEKKEYFCKRCGSEWTQIDVLPWWDPDRGFKCERCGNILIHDPNNNHGGHEQSTKYQAQFGFIVNLLPKIDEVIIPENTFEKALASARKVFRDETNPANDTAPVDPSAAKPTAVRGMANVGPTSISVTLTTSEGPTEADLAADRARKEKIATQNAMPVHFTHSTISGEQVKFGGPTLPSSQSLSDDKKSLDLDGSSVNGDGAEIDDYFARLKAEQAREAEKEKDEEFETDEDDDEDGFEDVLATGVTSPVTGPGTPIEDSRPAKMVKFEEPEEKEESEEDIEFIDV